MDYQFNEGSMVLPAAAHDSSVNILRFNDFQATLVISRETLKPGLTAEDYYQQQMTLLKKSMKNFLPGEKKTVALNGAPDASCCEFSCRFEQQGKGVWQRLLMVVTGQQVLIFAFTRQAPFDDASLDGWQRIIDSICLTGAQAA